MIKQHLSQLANLKVLHPNEIKTFSEKEEFSFKYALLLSGVFVHKWNENLSQYLSVRYRLSKQGKERISNRALMQAGFNIETAAISKRYFRFNYTPKNVDNDLIRNYGIETYLGYWIPLSVSSKMFAQDKFDEFKNRLFLEIKNQHLEIEANIKEDLNYLTSEGLIEEPTTNPVQSFNNKIRELANNELKLKRIYSKYELFPLPFDITQKKR